MDDSVVWYERHEEWWREGWGVDRVSRSSVYGYTTGDSGVGREGGRWTQGSVNNEGWREDGGRMALC